MYNRLHSIPACDGRTDRQTSCHGIVRAVHTRRAVKTRDSRRISGQSLLDAHACSPIWTTGLAYRTRAAAAAAADDDDDGNPVQAQ